MMAKAKPKKATSKHASSTKSAAADGVELARLRRLARAGFDGASRCALLGICLDLGPRAKLWQAPVEHGDDVVSQLAVAIVESGVPPKALELAAAQLRDRGKP